MKLSNTEYYALIVVAVVVIIWIIYTLAQTKYMPEGVFRETYDNMKIKAMYEYDKQFGKPADLYSKIVGYENDEVAKLAIQKAEKQENLHSYNEASKTITGKSIYEAANNSAILASMYRYNNRDPGHLRKAKKYYDKSIGRIRRAPLVIARENNPAYPAAETVIQEIEAFYAEQNILPEHNFNQIRENVREARAIQANYDANNSRKKKKSKNLSKLPKKSSKKQAAAAIYFDEKEVANNPQNVHDSETVSELGQRYKAIKEANAAEFDFYNSQDVPNLREFLDNFEFSSPDQKRKALKTFSNISKSPGLVSSLDRDAEKEIMAQVWRRVNSRENAGSRENLQAAFVQSLADSVEKTYSGAETSVCSAGRCSRLIDSLTLLDKNQEISEPVKTQDILRNEIFSKSYKILQDEVAAASPETRKIYNSVEALNPADSETLENFENQIKDKIKTIIESDYPNANKKILENIIRDAQAGI